MFGIGCTRLRVLGWLSERVGQVSSVTFLVISRSLLLLYLVNLSYRSLKFVLAIGSRLSSHVCKETLLRIPCHTKSFHTDQYFTARPTLTRTFTILVQSPDALPLHIRLREPSLTSDNLGHKTWLASYLLARRLPSLRPLLPSISHTSSTDSPRILELGSGTGLLGIAAEALYPNASVHLTDLEAIVSNLEANVKANEALFSKGRSPSVGVLDWSEPSTARLDGRFDLILASDPLYSPLHPAWLVDTIFKYLDGPPTSRVVIELPLREAYVPEVEELKKRMADGGLVLLDSGEELGTEDWGDDSGHGREQIRCWWGVWGWP